MFHLPIEIQEQIMAFTDFETCINIGYNKIAKKFYKPEVHTWGNVSRNGLLKEAKWLHANNIKACKTYIISEAAQAGHLELVKWIHLFGPKECTDNDCCETDWSLEPLPVGMIIRWHCNRMMFNFYAMDYSAANGHLEIVKFLHFNGYDCIHAMKWASKKGHVEIVRFLLQKTECCINKAMDYAIGHGQLEIVKLLHEYKKEYPKYVIKGAMDYATEKTYFEVVEWVNKNLILCN
jgi:hypothetical protein